MSQTSTAQRTVADIIPGTLRTIEHDDDINVTTLNFDSAEDCVGYIAFCPATGTIDGIEVHENLRRRGIATAMWHEALTICPHLRHDCDSELTDDGHDWARKVGGENAPIIPRLRWED